MILKLLMTLAVCMGCFVLTSCDMFNDTSGRDELARRAQCKENLRRLAQEIVDYKTVHGQWPTSLSAISNGIVMRCPSASVGTKASELDGVYTWNSARQIISENADNHRPDRHGALRLSNWVGAITLSIDGGGQ